MSKKALATTKNQYKDRSVRVENMVMFRPNQGLPCRFPYYDYSMCLYPHYQCDYCEIKYRYINTMKHLFQITDT